jgi:hypothetical protein
VNQLFDINAATTHGLCFSFTPLTNMSNPIAPTRDPKKWVQSPKRVWYWRHPTGSFWKGPPDDRVWVPSIDAPPDLEPPPDDLDDSSGQDSATHQNDAPQPCAPQQFGSVINLLVGGLPRLPPPQENAPQLMARPQPNAFGHSPFGRGDESTMRDGRPRTDDHRDPAPHTTIWDSHSSQPPPYFSTTAGSYSGPWAHTMRHRDESARVEQDR